VLNASSVIFHIDEAKSGSTNLQDVQNQHQRNILHKNADSLFFYARHETVCKVSSYVSRRIAF